MKKIPNSKMVYVLAPLVVLLLFGLPIAVFDTNLHRQACHVNSIRGVMLPYGLM